MQSNAGIEGLNMSNTEKQLPPLVLSLSNVKVANIHDTVRAGPVFGAGLKPGSIVAVRPCDKKLNGKTYLGMYLCQAPTAVYGKLNEANEIVLTMGDYTNPAIWVEELDRIVWGYESWWGAIKSEADLKAITNEDIKNVWYVKALEQISKTNANHADRADADSGVNG